MSRWEKRKKGRHFVNYKKSIAVKSLRFYLIPSGINDKDDTFSFALSFSIC